MSGLPRSEERDGRAATGEARAGDADDAADLLAALGLDAAERPEP